ncbi:MAG: YdcF family protein [Solirubrobacteraceae bacterium]
MLLGLAAGGAGALARTWVRIGRASRLDALETAGAVDAIVVLGAAVGADGTPCGELERRLAEAAALRARGLSETILCCGGHSPLGLSEAVAMRDALVRRGVPPDAVIVDEASTSTRRAVAATRLRGTRLRWERVVFVSSGYHIHRILREAERQSVAAVGHAPRADDRPPTRASTAQPLLQKAREIAAVWWYAASAPALRRSAPTGRGG